MQSCCQGFRFPLVFSLVFSFFFFQRLFHWNESSAGWKKGDTHALNVITDRNGGWRAAGRRGFTESCCCPQAPEHFLHYTSASSLFFFFLFRPAPSYCRKYQRHQLFFNLHSIHFSVECLNTNEGRDFCPLFDQCRLSHSHEGVVLEASRMHWGYLNKYSASTDHTKRWKWRERRDDTAEWSCGGT